ncbi:GntR family transcriptional regulator [Enterococcus faecalis]|nr:GntR family transcriptional regulator [Enterococcus faecalis]
MTRTKYLEIYESLRDKIDTGIYHEMMPSENTLVKEYGVSRNTIRRALKELTNQGLTVSIPGKGVSIISTPHSLGVSLDKIESFKQFTNRTHLEMSTKVLSFSEEVMTEELTKKLPFQVGETIYRIVRLRMQKKDPIVVDENYFLKDVVQNLTTEIAEDSIYEYLEKTLNIHVSTSKRVITVELLTKEDKELLHSHSYDTAVIIRNTAYTQLGKLFEYTISKHRPDKYVFTEVVVH